MGLKGRVVKKEIVEYGNARLRDERDGLQTFLYCIGIDSDYKDEWESSTDEHYIESKEQVKTAVAMLNECECWDDVKERMIHNGISSVDWDDASVWMDDRDEDSVRDVYDLLNGWLEDAAENGEDGFTIRWF